MRIEKYVPPPQAIRDVAELLKDRPNMLTAYTHLLCEAKKGELQPRRVK